MIAVLADLLLETRAKLKGTSARWKDMKTVKEDQYACVAHLGFVLHERSQERQESYIDATDMVEESEGTEDNSSKDDIASDVSARFMLREIEHFLNSRNLITELVEQRAEAKRFLELMQIEAGLIVERGTDENGESLYGFVHRTFQEYFAAADVYEQYQQEEDPTIISDFLKEHLHDPHWREVILLVLGKLKRKPVTAQLRHILEGKIKSRRSQHNDIVKQDLFFVCDCLSEDIAVENELAEAILVQVSNLVKNSPFPSQRIKGLESLSALVRTRQYSTIALKELMELVTTSLIPDISTRIEATKSLYLISPSESPARQAARNTLSYLLLQADLSFDQQLQAAQALYGGNASDSEEQRLATQMLLQLAQRPDFPSQWAIQAGATLYRYHFGTSEQQQTARILLDLIQRPDLSIEQAIQNAKILFQFSPSKSEEERQAAQVLLRLAKSPNLSFNEVVLLAQASYQCTAINSKEERQASEMLWQLLKNDITEEQRLQVAKAFIAIDSAMFSDITQAIQILMDLLQKEVIKQYFEEQLQIISIRDEAITSDIPFVVQLARQEILPTKIRDAMYVILREMVPQFGNIDELGK